MSGYQPGPGLPPPKYRSIFRILDIGCNQTKDGLSLLLDHLNDGYRIVCSNASADTFVYVLEKKDYGHDLK